MAFAIETFKTNSMIDGKSQTLMMRLNTICLFFTLGMRSLQMVNVLSCMFHEQHLGWIHFSHVCTVPMVVHGPIVLMLVGTLNIWWQVKISYTLRNTFVKKVDFQLLFHFFQYSLTCILWKEILKYLNHNVHWIQQCHSSEYLKFRSHKCRSFRHHAKVDIVRAYSAPCFPR